MSFEGVVKGVKEAVTDLQKKVNKAYTWYIGLVGEGDPSDESVEFMQALLKENAALPTACTAEKAARIKSQLHLTALRNDRASSKNRIEELTRLLAE